MSKGINKVILVGNLGQDPEVRAMNDGSSVVTISVATSESWKDKINGEKKESTEWHRVVFFGKLADVAAKYLVRGGKVYVEGKLQTKKWQDKQGIDRYTTQILASEMQMLDSKKDAAAQDAQSSAKEYAAMSGGRVENDPPPYADDDIPF